MYQEYSNLYNDPNDPYKVANPFLNPLKEGFRALFDVEPEKQLARAVIRQWVLDLERLIKALRKAQNTEIIEGLVYDLHHEALWPKTEIAEFWAMGAEIETKKLTHQVKKKIEHLLRSRPHLQPKILPILRALE